MKLQITVRNLEHLDRMIREEVRKRVEKLETYYDQIMSCRVVVEAPHHHHHEGVLYNVVIEIRVPGAEFVVKHQPSEEIDVSIRNAFDAARCRLEDYARQHRGAVKHHEGLPHGEITALLSDKGYGFLTTPDGMEIYFHEHSVINCDFEHLKVGMKVRFAEEQGEKGPQASTVTVMD